VLGHLRRARLGRERPQPVSRREVRASELVGALLAHAEELGDLDKADTLPGDTSGDTLPVLSRPVSSCRFPVMTSDQRG
jgi:hypothetical protein